MDDDTAFKGFLPFSLVYPLFVENPLFQNKYLRSLKQLVRPKVDMDDDMVMGVEDM